MTLADLPWGKLADRARAEMHRRGLTQAELARRLGVNPDTVNDFVNGHRYTRMPRIVDLIDEELGWPQGMARAILDDRPPPAEARPGAATDVVRQMRSLAQSLLAVADEIERGEQY